MNEIKISSKLAKKVKIAKGVRVSIEMLAKIEESGEEFSKLVNRLLEEEFNDKKRDQ